MKVVEEGHSYLVSNFNNKEDNSFQEIFFVKKEIINGESVFTNGTTNEELLKVLRSRYKHQQKCQYYPETKEIISHLDEIIKLTEDRKTKLRAKFFGK
jgi:hypothetical protein